MTDNYSREIYKKLKEDILNGKIKGNERLKQSEIAKNLDVSRMPVRQALKYLEEDGLIVIIPNKGARVVGFDIDDLVEIFFIRKMLEIKAFEFAVSNFSSKDISSLIEINREFEERIDAKDFNGAIKVNQKFHFTIYEKSNLNYLNQLIKNIWNVFPRYTFAYDSESDNANKSKESVKQSVKDHWNIIDAISRKDEENGSEILYKHIEDGQTKLIQQLQLKEK